MTDHAKVPTLQSMLEETFTHRVAHTAQRLRDLADEIEREGTRIGKIPTPGTTSAAALAAHIMHSLTWGIANASPDGIMAAAAEYDFHLKDERPPEGSSAVSGGTR